MVQFLQKAICLVTVSLYLTATAEADDHTPNRATLLAYIDAWNTSDVDRLDALVAADFQRHAGPDESCRSLAELKQLVSSTHAIWNNLRLTVDDSMATDTGGALRGSFYGVHRPTSGIIEFPTMNMFRFVDGRITDEWIIGDNFLSLMALGYELVPPGFDIVPIEEDPPPSAAGERGIEK